MAFGKAEVTNATRGLYILLTTDFRSHRKTLIFLTKKYMKCVILFHFHCLR